MTNITGRSIWIIGASSGIGRCLAEQLAAQNNFVIATARDNHQLQKLSSQCQHSIKFFTADFSEQFNSHACQQQLAELTDYLDLVIYCAGICEYDDQESNNLDIYQRALDINFLGAVRAWKIASAFLQRAEKHSALKSAKQKPQFAVISSLSTCVGFPRAEAYGASKAALNYWMQSLKADYARLPIDFSIIRPGFVDTRLTQQNDFMMPSIMSPHLASQLILRKLNQRKFWIDFPFQIAWPLKFFSWFPWLWFNLAAPRITRLRQWKTP